MSAGFNRKNFYWWKDSKDQIHESVFQYIQFLDRNQDYRTQENLKNMRLYGNFDMMGTRAYSYMRTESSYSIQNRVTYNVVQSMVDTVVSKITKNKPKPTFLTSGGDFSLQRRAKKLTKFSEGQFQNTDFYSKASIAFLDSCIFGTGCLKIFKQNNEIKVERVFIEEIVVDDSESLYGDPRQMHQTKFIHKDVLKDMFPKYAAAIEAATADARDPNRTDLSNMMNTDMVRVIESWHLPSGKDAKDGKHAITIHDATLFEEDYKKDYFPFVFFRWGLRPLGFFGQGIADQLTGLQMEINKILRTIQVSMHLVSIPKIYVEAGSKIVSAHLNNKIGGVIKYQGAPPTPGPLANVPPELFAHLQNLYARAFEIIGVSQLSAQSSKPSGLDSGKALREFNDIETERFMSVGLRYEKAFMEAAKQMIDLAKEIDEETDGFKVKVQGKKFLETISWSEVDLPDEKYSMAVFPTSSLSSTPSGRFKDVQELLQAGFIGKEEGLKLLDFPDLESFYNMANAGVEDIDRQIELMIDKGEYQTPEPYQNLNLGIVKMQQAYLMFKSQKAPEDRLELFRRWIEDANALMQRATDAAAQEAGQLAAAEEIPANPADALVAGDPNAALVAEDPQAVAEAQPTSEILPQG